MNKKSYRRGDIVYVDFNRQFNGSVQEGPRPCVIVSNDTNNRASNVVNVVPLTSSDTKNFRKTHVEIRPNDVKGYLPKHSFALCEQLQSVDKRKLMCITGSVREETEIMDMVNEALRLQLSL